MELSIRQSMEGLYLAKQLEAPFMSELKVL